MDKAVANKIKISFKTSEHEFDHMKTKTIEIIFINIIDFASNMKKLHKIARRLKWFYEEQ